MQKEDCSHYIEATLKTWEKDSHGLHDYELSAKSKEFKVSAKNSFCLGRKKTGNWFFSTSSSVNGMPLLSVINIKGKYFVDNWFQKQTTTCYDDYRNWNWIPTIAYDNFTPFRNCHKVVTKLAGHVPCLPAILLTCCCCCCCLFFLRWHRKSRRGHCEKIGKNWLMSLPDSWLDWCLGASILLSALSVCW